MKTRKLNFYFYIYELNAPPAQKIKFFLKLHALAETRIDRKLKHGDINQAIDQMSSFVFSHKTASNWLTAIKKTNNVESLSDVTTNMLEKAVEMYTNLAENNKFRFILNPNQERMLEINQYQPFPESFLIIFS